MSDAFTDSPLIQEQDDSNEWLIAFVIVLLLINGNANRPMTPVQRKRARDLLRTKFEQDATRNAIRVTSGDLPLDAWQLATGGIIADYIRQMTVAGAGTIPAATVQVAAVEAIQAQQPFLTRFAQAVALGALTVGAIAARSKLYGGQGWGLYFMAQGSNTGDGIIERWESRDDKYVCPRCAPRHGQFYLPSQPPWPGIDCLGSCRCERVQVVNRELWARLSGRRAA